MEMLLRESKDTSMIPQCRRYNRGMHRPAGFAAIWLAAAAFGPAGARAEVHNMTLRQAVGRAIQQNPDVTLARLEEENARHAVGIARDPFSPKVDVGSGLAYSNGFPLS